MKAHRAPNGALLLVGALLGPPTVMSAYLALSRWPSRWFTEQSDLLFLMLSIGSGLACLLCLSLPAPARFVLACLYVPAAAFALVLYSLFFVGLMFGDYL